jgi:hypothetical protein
LNVEIFKKIREHTHHVLVGNIHTLPDFLSFK